MVKVPELVIGVTLMPIFPALSYSLTAVEIAALRETPIDWVKEMYGSEIKWGRQGIYYEQLWRDTWLLLHDPEKAGILEKFKDYLRAQHYDPTNMYKAQGEAEKIIVERSQTLPNLMQQTLFFNLETQTDDKETSLVERFCRMTASALAVRDSIADSNSGFGQREYDILTSAYRAIVGPIHPDDESLTL